MRYNFVEGVPTTDEDYKLFTQMQIQTSFRSRITTRDKYKVVVGYEYTNPDLFEERFFGEKFNKGESFKVIGI